MEKIFDDEKIIEDANAEKYNNEIRIAETHTTNYFSEITDDIVKQKIKNTISEVIALTKQEKNFLATLNKYITPLQADKAKQYNMIMDGHIEILTELISPEECSKLNEKNHFSGKPLIKICLDTILEIMKRYFILIRFSEYATQKTKQVIQEIFYSYTTDMVELMGFLTDFLI